MENLGIDIKLVIAQLVNFAIFFFVFQKFISKPFLAYLNKKREEDQQRIEFTERLKNREEELRLEDQKLGKERKKVLDAAILSGKEEATKVRDEIIADAKRESEKMVLQGKEHLAAEKEELYKDLRRQVAAVSMLVVDKALKEFLTEDARKSVTQNVIKHIPENTKLEN